MSGMKKESCMRVQIVSFHCVLKNKLGHFISSSFNHDVATSNPTEAPSALPGFIEGLRGLKKGQKKKISVDADQAYGFYNQDLVVEVARSKFDGGQELRIGHQVMANFAHEDEPRVYRVVGTTKSKVTVDGNHPLAGQDLVFDVEVTSSRLENEEELDLSPQNKTGLLQ
jgi:FKBP-type peptidyl-prolyl cis-trans isomerase SlyD